MGFENIQTPQTGLAQLIETYGTKILVYVIAIMAVSAIGCFFGYKLSKLFTVICNFLTGVMCGIILVAITGNTMFYNPVGFLIGFALAALSFKFEKFGIFLTTFSIGGLFIGGIASSILYNSNAAELAAPLNAANTADSNQMRELNQVLANDMMSSVIFPSLIIMAISGLIIGVLSLKFPKPVMIICTSVGFGTLAGSMLAALIGNPKLEIPFWIALVVLGLIVQIKMNDGLSEDPYGRPQSRNFDPQEYVNPYAMPGQPNPQFGSRGSQDSFQRNDFFDGNSRHQ